MSEGIKRLMAVLYPTHTRTINGINTVTPEDGNSANLMSLKTQRRRKCPPKHMGAHEVSSHRRQTSKTAQPTTSGTFIINDFVTCLRLKHYPGVFLFLLSKCRTTTW